jgi:hypothetical protein
MNAAVGLAARSRVAPNVSNSATRLRTWRLYTVLGVVAAARATIDPDLAPPRELPINVRPTRVPADGRDLPAPHFAVSATYPNRIS